MIIPVIGKSNREEFLVCPRAPATLTELRDRMLRRAKVTEGSYAYRLINDLHAAIFARSLELKLDYEEYFGLEYASFGEYLRRRARFPSSVVAKLIANAEVSSGVYQFRPEYTFLADEYGLKFLTRLLEKGPPGEES